MSSNETQVEKDARVSQTRAVVDTFLESFGKPVDLGNSRDTSFSIYHENIIWFDHAFHICRKGREAIRGLKKTFLHCNQPFKSVPKAVRVWPEGAVVEQIWIGCCKNDIVRADGSVAVRASGRHFHAHVCMIMAIDVNGLITRIDEYYNKAWDQGISEDHYMVMGESKS